MAIEQRDQTLTRMVNVGYITRERAEEIKAMKIVLNEKPQQNEVQRSYALRAVKRELEDLMEKENILINGLQVYTTLDMAWQTRLEDELNFSVRALETEKAGIMKAMQIMMLGQ